jgi:hypothetical protein
MEFLHRLIVSHGPLKRTPCPDLIVGDTGAVRDRIIACKADDGSYAYVYAATGGKIVIGAANLAGDVLNVWWMSPKDGIITLPQRMEKAPLMEFTSPNSGEGCDWVLIIQTV